MRTQDLEVVEQWTVLDQEAEEPLRDRRQRDLQQQNKNQTQSQQQRMGREEAGTPQPMQVREEAEQFLRKKLPQMRPADLVEEEIPSLVPVAHEEVEMWETKTPGRRESGQFKTMVPGEVDPCYSVHGVAEL